LSGFFRIHAGDETIPAVGVVAAGARVELAGLAGDALRDDLGVAVDQDTHYSLARSRDDTSAPLAAATAFSPASAMLFALMIGSPDSARIFLPSSSLVPFMRTTSGTLSLTSRAAATIPVAIVSHFMMPPKMLTNIALRPDLRSMILNASVTFSAVAPPPTSRKFAGDPPKCLMVSMVAMARPAPLTMQPMLPSSVMKLRS